MGQTAMDSKYAGRPNLWRVAKELARFSDPYKAADALLLAIKSRADDTANSE